MKQTFWKVRRLAGPVAQMRSLVNSAAWESTTFYLCRRHCVAPVEWQGTPCRSRRRGEDLSGRNIIRAGGVWQNDTRPVAENACGCGRNAHDEDVFSFCCHIFMECFDTLVDSKRKAANQTGHTVWDRCRIGNRALMRGELEKKTHRLDRFLLLALHRKSVEDSYFLFQPYYFLLCVARTTRNANRPNREAITTSSHPK